MKHAIDVTGFGAYADAAVVANVAGAAEEAGWDGLFIWDHLAWATGIPCGDPWVSLAAAATATDRIQLGVGVCPLPRRRPQVVATAGAALDRLSGGRFIFGAGLGGVDREFEAFGEPCDASERAAMLDEGLGLLDLLWRGEVVEHQGHHYRMAGVRLEPASVRHPRPPIWIGGTGPGALRRASRWDGYHAGPIVDEAGNRVVEPEDIERRLKTIGPGEGFDVAVAGASEPGDSGVRNEFAEAGATWWLETIHDFRGPLDAMLDRVAAGA